MAVGKQDVRDLRMKAVDLAVVVAIDGTRAGRCRQSITLRAMQEETVSVVGPARAGHHQRGRIPTPAALDVELAFLECWLKKATEK